MIDLKTGTFKEKNNKSIYARVIIISLEKDNFTFHSMNEFKINDFLTLRLEENTINIYVKGEFFEQCKFLMVNIPTKRTKKNDEIDSMNEVANLLRWTEDGQQGIKSRLNDLDRPFITNKLEAVWILLHCIASNSKLQNNSIE